jgi:hypothetical protein
MQADFSAGRPPEQPLRRLVGHDPLEGGGSFGKPAGLVVIRFDTHRPSLFELKIRNVVIAETMHQLADDPERRDFVTRAALLRRAAGQRASRSNTRLRAALDAMVAPPGETLLPDGDASILASWESPDAETISWQVDGRVLGLLCNPNVWAWLDLDICARLQRTASLVLYERLRLVANRDWPVLALSIAELRGALGLTTQMRGSDFLGKILMPAIKELEKSGLTISVTLERERRHGALSKITVRLPHSSPRRRSNAEETRNERSTPSACAKTSPVQSADLNHAFGRQRSAVPQSGAASDVPRFVVPPAPRARTARGLIFDDGIAMLVAQGCNEPTARSFLGKLLSQYDDGYVAVVVDRACREQTKLADVRSWMTKRLRRYPTREIEREMRETKKGWMILPATNRPLATPENLGISPALAAEIREKNKETASWRIPGLDLSHAGATGAVDRTLPIASSSPVDDGHRNDVPF